MEYEVTNEIIDDAREKREEKKLWKHSNFYDSVYQGSYEVVSKVIDDLKKPVNEDLLKWLLPTTNKNETETNGEETKDKTKPKNRKKFIMGFVLIPLWILFTPIFYFLHLVIYNGLNTKYAWKVLSLSKKRNIDLPLAFAVLSGNKKMIKLFLNHVSVEDKDKWGNNILHYLADLSNDNMDHAMVCYNKLLEVLHEKTENEATANIKIKSKKYTHDMINKLSFQENNDLVDVFEYATHFGGKQFASKLIEDTTVEILNPITRKYEFMLCADDYYNKSKQKEKNGNINKYIQRNKLRMNITRDTLESRNGFLSQALNFLVSRELTSQSEASIVSIQNNACLQKWLKIKIKQWRKLVYLSGVIDIAVSLYLFVVVSSMGELDLNWTPNRNLFTKYHTEIFLTRWNQTGNHNFLANSFFSRYPDILTLFDNNDKFMDYTELIELIRNLDGYDSFSRKNMTQLYISICVTGTQYLPVGDMIKLDNCSIIASEKLTSHCADSTSRYRYHFNDETIDTYEFAITSSFIYNIFIHKRSSIRNFFTPNDLSTEALFIFGFFLYTFFLLQIFLDIGIRLWTLINIIRSNGTLYSVFGASPIPGSYLKGQMAMYSYCGTAFYAFYHWENIKAYLNPPNEVTDLLEDILSYDRSAIDNLHTNLPLCIFLVTIVISRFFLHLHFMKILPWLGSFVITLFEMSVDLVAFWLIYLVVDIFFGSLFYAFTRHPDCPIKQADTLGGFVDTLFASFAFIFGHVELELLTYPMQVTYVFYVLTTIFILLNLIIAIITAKATYVTVEPWLSQLHQNAKAREALGMEHLISPFTNIQWFKSIYFWSLKRSKYQLVFKDKRNDQDSTSNMKNSQVNTEIEETANVETNEDKQYNDEKNYPEIYIHTWSVEMTSEQNEHNYADPSPEQKYTSILIDN